MGHTLAICQRELWGYFATPIGGVLLAASSLFFVPMIYAAGNHTWGPRLAVPVFALTGFRPTQDLATHPVLLVVGFARVLALSMIPLLTMRLFPEEKQARTIEMLLTSPVNESDIVLGKWLAALLLYLLLIGVGILEFAISPWTNWDGMTALTGYIVLLLIGAGLLAMGECISALAKHQFTAAWVTLAGSALVLRYCNSGALRAGELTLCALLMLFGWRFTLQSIRVLRESF